MQHQNHEEQLWEDEHENESHFRAPFEKLLHPHLLFSPQYKARLPSNQQKSKAHMLSFTTYCTKSADFKRKERKHQGVHLKGQKEEGWGIKEHFKPLKKISPT